MCYPTVTERFQNRAHRDARAKQLKVQGMRVRRSSARNQLLHPMYIEDYERALSKEECGFGNTLYKTHFPAIYTVEAL